VGCRAGLEAVAKRKILAAEIRNPDNRVIFQLFSFKGTKEAQALGFPDFYSVPFKGFRSRLYFISSVFQAINCI
jgi:hypothetical protein